MLTKVKALALLGHLSFHTNSCGSRARIAEHLQLTDEASAAACVCSVCKYKLTYCYFYLIDLTKHHEGHKAHLNKCGASRLGSGNASPL